VLAASKRVISHSGSNDGQRPNRTSDVDIDRRTSGDKYSAMNAAYSCRFAVASSLHVMHACFVILR
jgi:hypothetical protein